LLCAASQAHDLEDAGEGGGIGDELRGRGAVVVDAGWEEGRGGGGRGGAAAVALLQQARGQLAVAEGAAEVERAKVGVEGLVDLLVVGVLGLVVGVGFFA
jgi:hypothetical protein